MFNVGDGESRPTSWGPQETKCWLVDSSKERSNISGFFWTTIFPKLTQKGICVQKSNSKCTHMNLNLKETARH